MGINIARENNKEKIMTEDQTGAVIESGLADWQILQQDATGFATLTLRGRWESDQSGIVEVRVVAVDTGFAVSRATDWQAATTETDGTWHTTMHVPAGGLYRLETHFMTDEQEAREWATRGDLRHFWGVGDLWVIAGQSNSTGYGRGAVYDPPEMGLHLFRNSEAWTLAFHPMNDSTDTAHPVNRDDANSGHSPYLHFARLLKQELGYPIGLVQTSLGGSPLSQWNPTENEDAQLYNNMLHCIERVGGMVKGVLWYQGEADSLDPMLAKTYAERFEATVKAWRAALKQPNLTVLTAQINRFHSQPDIADPESDASQRGWSIVQEAQRQVAHSTPHLSVVPTLDLPLSDMIHNSPAGNMMLGERMARTALGMVYGHDIHYKAPDARSAQLVNDGKRIELTFENVTDRMDNISIESNCFVVEDDEGLVPLTRVEYPMDATIQLVLERSLVGQAVVHGAFGYDPPTVPVDMNRLMPMLGFYGLSVT
jgi:sialate O-acetylesterase